MNEDDDLIRRLKTLPRSEPSGRLRRRVHLLPQSHSQAETLVALFIRLLGDWQYRPAFKIACLLLLFAGGFAAGQTRQIQTDDALSGFILGDLGTEG